MPKSSIKIIYYKEMRNLINRVKQIGLNSCGILFGGVVRDDIIGKYYRKMFINKYLDYNNYWDNNYDIETKYRTIIPKDIDIYFKSENNSTTFINDLRKLVQRFGGNINVTVNNNINHMNYINNYVNFKHKKVNIHIIVGGSLTQPGISLYLDIDIIEIDGSRIMRDNIEYIDELNKIEPPFNNLDFLSNIFIIEKRNSIIMTRLSNCTGTPIDNMLFSEKTNMASKIIKDILNFKTQFVSKIDCFNTEYVNCFRILKMIEKNFPWNITNIPFKFLKIIDINEIINDKCCICLEDIKIDDMTKDEIMENYKEIVELNTNKKKKNYLHNKCFINYLKKEQKARYVDDNSKKIECRCPFRNIFNFRDCYKEIEYL